MINFSNEFYRALARYVLDLWYRNSLDMAVSNTNLNTVLNDGGFNLTSAEINAIDCVIKSKSNVDEIIFLINGHYATNILNCMGTFKFLRYKQGNPIPDKHIVKTIDGKGFLIPKSLEKFLEDNERFLKDEDEELVIDVSKKEINIQALPLIYKEPPAQVKPVDVVGK